MPKRRRHQQSRLVKKPKGKHSVSAGEAAKFMLSEAVKPRSIGAIVRFGFSLGL